MAELHAAAGSADEWAEVVSSRPARTSGTRGIHGRTERVRHELIVVQRGAAVVVSFDVVRPCCAWCHAMVCEVFVEN